MPGNEVFPSLVSCIKLGAANPSRERDHDIERIYDVKFYPYATTDNDQIFAAVNETDAFVCRPRLGNDPPFEILRFFRDEAHTRKPSTSFNALAWTKHPKSRKPLLCIAGHEPKQIKILEIESGHVFRALAGHGGGINDLAISPLSTNLLASCAEDYTIRLWNLEPKYEIQPCIALFVGAGHRAPILAIKFHPNGKWLLSGGIDTAVCLWSVPDLAELNRTAEDSNDREPKIIYYPQFYSKEVHSNYVDSVEFFGDLIISRSARDPKDKSNEILIWKINGFNADDAPPERPPIPVPESRTRSAFPHDPRYRGFQRLLTLDMPNTDRFYYRFSLLQSPGMRPILAMGSQKSKYHFWDLQRLEEDGHVQNEKKPRSRKPLATGGRNSANPEVSSDKGGQSSSTTAFADNKTTPIDPFKAIEAHYTKIAATKLSSNQHFGTSQMAWSPDGTWLVGVGDHGMMSIFHRDKSVVDSSG